MEKHTHNIDPAKGLVCSSLVTDAVLVSLGIVQRFTDKCMGTDVVTRPGLDEVGLRTAKMLHPQIRTCTLDPRSLPVLPPKDKLGDPAHVADALAFVAAVRV